MFQKEIGLHAPNVTNHSRFNSQYDGGTLCDHLTSARIVTLVLKEMFIQAPKFMEKVSTTLIWLC